MNNKLEMWKTHKDTLCALFIKKSIFILKYLTVGFYYLILHNKFMHVVW